MKATGTHHRSFSFLCWFDIYIRVCILKNEMLYYVYNELSKGIRMSWRIISTLNSAFYKLQMISLCWLSGLMDNLVLVKSDNKPPASKNQSYSEWHAIIFHNIYSQVRQTYSLIFCSLWRIATNMYLLPNRLF